jgi:ubiquinone/menaquinone biosynthesis C-methylase UbiE/DNA-binding MarR family transcriptional regulator
MDNLLLALRAVAEPTRIRIFALCADNELTVSDLTRILGQSQPRVSRHLKLLTEAGLLERMPEGSWVFYRRARDHGGRVDKICELLPTKDEVLAHDRKRLAEVKVDRLQAAEEYFSRNALAWNGLRSLHVDEAEVEAAMVCLLPETGVHTLLDMGTGTGRLLELFAGRVESAIGVDTSHEMLSAARANLAQAGIANCSVRQADMFQIPFRAGSFDAVTIHQVLHFLDQPVSALSEAVRVLRPNGYLLLVDFAPHDLETLRNEHQHRRLGFSEQEVRTWFGSVGLKEQEVIQLSGDPLTVTIWLAKNIGLELEDMPGRDILSANG